VTQEINKIVILGCCGAGKSTLAFKLHKHLKLPLYHLDQIFWKSGWIESERHEYEVKHHELIQNPKWIIDGNFSFTLDTRLEASDLVIIMDIPRWQCLWGIIKRSIRYYGKTRPDMTLGCNERIDWEFIKYVWRFHRDQLPQTLEIVNRFRDKKQIIKVTNRKQLDGIIVTLNNTN